MPSPVRKKFSLFALYPSHSRRTFVLGPEHVHDGFVTLETNFDRSDFYPCSWGGLERGAIGRSWLGGRRPGRGCCWKLRQATFVARGGGMSPKVQIALAQSISLCRHRQYRPIWTSPRPTPLQGIVGSGFGVIKAFNSTTSDQGPFASRRYFERPEAPVPDFQEKLGQSFYG